MEHLQRLQQYLIAQPVRHLWVSTLVLLACFVASWYTWGYKPLLCSTRNFEERFSLCTNVREKDSQAEVDFKNLEKQYQSTVSFLRDYKGDRDMQTFYHSAVDQVVKNIRLASCSLVSFSGGVDVSQPLYLTHQATVVCAGSHEAIMYCLRNFMVTQSLWRVTSLALEMGQDTLYHLTLGIQCLALV